MTDWKRMPEYTADLHTRTLVHFPELVQEATAHVLGSGGVACKAEVKINQRDRSQGWLTVLVPCPNSVVTISYLPLTKHSRAGLQVRAS